MPIPPVSIIDRVDANLIRTGVCRSDLASLKLFCHNSHISRTTRRTVTDSCMSLSPPQQHHHNNNNITTIADATLHCTTNCRPTVTS